MTLFDPALVDPTKLRGAGRLEPEYQYLSTSARPSASRIRSILESWWALYPDDHKPDLRRRFGNRAGHVHAEAFWELLMFGLFTHMGARVTVHPIVPGATSRPDFLIEHATGETFYLEATVESNTSDQDRARHAVKQQLFDTINRRSNNPGFVWAIDVEECGSGQLKPRAVIHELSAFAGTLDYDQVVQHVRTGGFPPKFEFVYCADGWRIHFEPWPLAPGQDPKSVEQVAIEMMPGEWTNIDDAIMGAILGKCAQHPILDLPLVVALNSTHSYAFGTRDFANALYGKAGVFVQHMPDGTVRGAFGRRSACVWRGPTGARNGQLVAVLGGTQIGAWNFHHRELIVFRQPGLDPEPLTVWPLPRFLPDETVSSTDTLGECLELPGEWHEGPERES